MISNPDNNNNNHEDTTTSSPFSYYQDLKLRLLFLCMGMASLVPYNAMITCGDYYDTIKYPKYDDVTGKLAAGCVSSLLVCTLILLPLSMSIPDAEDDDGGGEREGRRRRRKSNTGIINKILNLMASSASRVILGYVMSILTLLLFAYVTVQPSSSYLSLVALLLAANMVGGSDSVTQSGLYVVAAATKKTTIRRVTRKDGGCDDDVVEEESSPMYSAAVTLGSAISGLFIGVLRLGTRTIFVKEERKNDEGVDKRGLTMSVATFFLLSSGFIVLCIWFFGMIPPLDEDNESETCESVVDEDRNQPESQDDYNSIHRHPNDSSLVLGDENGLGNGKKKGWELVSPTDPDRSDHNGWNGSNGNGLDTSQTTTIATTLEQQYEEPTNNSILHSNFFNKYIFHNPRLTIYLDTISYTWKPTLSTFLNFFVTLSLFPGTITHIQSIPPADGQHQLLYLGDWLPEVLITIFNAADVLGRVILCVDRWGVADFLLQTEEVEYSNQNDSTITTTQRTKILTNMDSLIYHHSILRVLLFYPLIILCIIPNKTSHPIIQSDIWRILIVFGMGLGNGFIATSSFMVTPQLVEGLRGGDEGRRMRDASSLMLLLGLYFGLAGGAYFGLVVNLLLGV